MIERVETFVVEQTLEKPFSFSQWDYNKRSICLVRITTKDGQYGWGEGYGPSRVIRAGIEFFTPYLLGKDPLQEEVIWQTLYRRSLDYARRGVLTASLSAIDVALWDLKGKLLKQPVSVLLGGRKREKVSVYATGMYFTETPDLPKALAKEAKMYAQQGYQWLKMKVGRGITEDVENVSHVREAIGSHVHLMVDSNHAFSRSEAAELAREIEPLDISWFEEPLSPEDYEGYRELRQRTKIPIAAGECEFLRFGFKQLFENQSVDIAQPDICAAGGLTEVKKIAAMAQTYGVEVTPHCWGTGIAFAAGLHFMSNLDIYPGRLIAPEPVLEMDRTENPLRDQLIQPKFSPKNGAVDVPKVPGLGIDVDAKLLKKFSAKD
jgi:D-galactarolactone cycloisomerase